MPTKGGHNAKFEDVYGRLVKSEECQDILMAYFIQRTKLKQLEKDKKIAKK